MTNKKITIGRYMRSLRIARKLSVSGMAKLLDVSSSYLSQVELDRRGDLVPTERTLRKFAEVTKCNFDEVMAMAGRIPVDLKNWLLKNWKKWEELAK